MDNQSVLHPLTKAQETILARTPNFAIVPKCSPKEAYITSVKEACIRVSPKAVENLRVKASQVLIRNCPPSKPNISQEETKVIRELKEDIARVILTTYKGMAMVLVNRQDYYDKANQLLADCNTHKPIHKGPTNKLKKRMAQTLRDINSQGGLSDSMYKGIYPTSAVTPKFCCLPKKYIRLASPQAQYLQ